MKRVIIAALAAAAVLVAFAHRGAAQRVSVLHVRPGTIDELRTWDVDVAQRERAGELRVKSVDRDPMMPARVTERLQQYHRGVPIWGAEVVRDLEQGVTQSLFGELSPDLDLSVTPALSAGDGDAALLALGGPGAKFLTNSEVVVLRIAGDHKLAYAAVVAGGDAIVRAFVDANTGSLLLRLNEMQSQAAIGSGQGVLGDLKKMSVLKEGGAYYADDQMHPPRLLTYDMRGNLGHVKNVLGGDPLFPSDRAADGDNSWDDPIAVDAHAHVGWTYDYYFKRFGRRGLDNRDRPLVALVDPLLPREASQLDAASQGQYVANAFWCGTCGPNPTGVMYFGSGFLSTFRYQGKWFVRPLAAALDVIAHELTHGVTDSTSRLLYQNESGALNEAFSDMMGTSVEFYYQSFDNNFAKADYIIAEDVFTGVPGVPDGLRSMSNPEIYDQPDHYSNFQVLKSTDDNGGVHVNSGIPNHAFYLAIEGGVNRTSRLAVQGVGAANREQIEKVFYRAFVTLLPADATFATARGATIQAARDLYGAGGAVERAVTQAWTAVGVF